MVFFFSTIPIVWRLFKGAWSLLEGGVYSRKYSISLHHVSMDLTLLKIISRKCRQTGIAQ